MAHGMKSEVTVEELRKQVEDFETATRSARASSEQVRDHRDLKQWTGEQLKELERRHQAPLVIPKIAAKVDFLMGLERQGRADPKAYPRNPEQDEKSAGAATDALRFVADNTDFDQTASAMFEQACLVEGYAAAIIEPAKRRGKIEIDINFIPFDRYYYDSHCRDRFFRDKTYDGFITWMDIAEAKRRWPKKAAEIDSACSSHSGASGDTFEDKPQWIDSQRKRIKVCQHYFLREGVWHIAIFTDGVFLVDAMPCPLKDEDGEPQNPIEALHGYIDRENNRYGFAKSLIGLEIEILHRRQKALHAISTNQILYEKGALSDPRKVSSELKKPDGAVELPPGALENGRVQIRTNTELAAGQVQLLQEANAEFESRGASSMAMDTESGMSGRALRTIDTNRKLEIGPLLDGFRHWKLRVYRQVWNRIKQFWDEERWVRVTDDEDNLKWVGFNQKVTVAQRLHEKAEEGDQQAAMMLEQLTAANDPRLGEVFEVRNNIPEMDIDLIIDEAPDAITVQQEQFEMLMELVPTYGPDKVPFELMLELSSIRNKDKISEKLQGNPQQAQQAAQLQQMQQQLQEAAAQLSLEKTAAEKDKIRAEIAEIAATVRKLNTETKQNELENLLVTAFPDTRPNVNV